MVAAGLTLTIEAEVRSKCQAKLEIIQIVYAVYFHYVRIKI